jgi:hypothetical protein
MAAKAVCTIGTAGLLPTSVNLAERPKRMFPIRATSVKKPPVVSGEIVPGDGVENGRSRFRETASRPFLVFFCVYYEPMATTRPNGGVFAFAPTLAQRTGTSGTRVGNRVSRSVKQTTQAGERPDWVIQSKTHA